MAENDSILGTIGAISFWGALGVAGKEAYSYYKTAKQVVSDYKSRTGGVNAVRNSVLSPSEIMSRFHKTSETGIDKFKVSMEDVTSMSIADFSKEYADLYGTSADNLSQRFTAISEKMGSNGNIKVRFTKQGGAVVPYETFIESKFGDLSFGKISHNGTIHHASTGSITKNASYTRNFLGYGFYDAIEAGTSQPFDSLIQKYLMNHNLATLEVIERNLGHVPGAKKELAHSIFNRSVLHMNKNTLNNVSDWVAAVHQSTMTPLVHVNARDYVLNPFDSVSNTPTMKYIEYMKQNYNGNIPMSFGVSQSNLADATYLAPGRIHPELQKVYGQIERATGFSATGGHQLNQMFSRSTKMVGSHGFADAALNDIASSTNLSAINSVYIPKDDKHFGSLLGMLDSPVPAVAGDEGMIVSRSLANKEILSELNFSVPTQDVYASDELQGLLDYFVTYNTGTYKGNASLASNQSMTIMERNAMFRQLVENNEMPKMLEHMQKNGNQINLKKIMHGLSKNGNILTAGETGLTRMDYRGNITLKNIAFTENGLRFEGTHQSKFRNSFSKMWGSLKAIGLREVRDNDLKRAVAYRMTMEKHGLKDTSLSYKAIAKHNVYGKTYKEILSALPNDMSVIFDDPRKMPFEKVNGARREELATIQNLTNANQRALKDKVNPTLADYVNEFKYEGDNGITFMQSIASFDKDKMFAGVRQGHNVHVNSIMANRLRSIGVDAAADYISSSFDYSGGRNMMESFATIFANEGETLIPKNAVVFDMDHITKGVNEDQLKSMFIADSKKAHSFASDLAVAKGLIKQENVKDSTKFFIKVSNKTAKGNVSRIVPVPTFESGYTMVLNESNHLYETGRPLMKDLSEDIYKFLNTSMGGDPESIAHAWDRLQRTTMSTVLDPNMFTTVMHSEATLGVAKDSFILNNDFITNSLGLKEDVANEILGKHNLNLKSIEDSHWVGLNKSDYARLSESYKGAADPWVVIGRNPGYAHQGFTMSRAVDMETLTQQLYTAAGKQMPLAGNFVQGSMFVSNAVKRGVGIDWDKDVLTMIGIVDENARNKSVEQFAAAKENVLDFMQSRVLGSKGTMKAGGIRSNEDLMRSSIIEGARAEKGGISAVYLKARAYQQPYMDFKDVLKESHGVSVAQKAAILDQFMTNMPETVIGMKDVAQQEQIDELTRMFSAENLEESEKTFRKYFNWKFTDSKAPIQDIFTSDEIQGVFKKGKPLHTAFDAILSQEIFSPKRAREIIGEAMHAGIMGKQSHDASLSMFEDITRSIREANKGRLAMETIGDASEHILPKIVKNKTVIGLAGASLLAGLVLRPTSSHVRTQEVREESRPKPVREGANPVDPPEASVYKPTVPGYNVNVRGNAPSGISARSIAGHLGGMGLANTNTVIDRSSSPDAKYIKDMQEEDRLNKWNVG
jgi:hypothetical protein